MDVGHIKGSGGVDRGPERPSRREHEPRADATPAKDSAAISHHGRETAAAVEALAERARRDEPGRERRVLEAKAALERGELDRFDVLQRTAEILLDRL